MSDARLRDLERRKDVSVQDRAAWLTGRLRVGTISPDMLVLAAFCLDPGARLAVLGRTEEDLRYPVREDAATQAYPILGASDGPVVLHSGRIFHAGHANLTAVRDSPSSSLDAWARWLARHPMPYVAKRAAVAVLRRVQGQVEKEATKRSTFTDLPRVLSSSGDSLRACEAWLSCPCARHRFEVSETSEGWSRADPLAWWRGTVALICDWAPVSETLPRIFGSASLSLTPDPHQRRVRRKKMSAQERETAARLVCDVVAADLASWALLEHRPATEPLTFRTDLNERSRAPTPLPAPQALPDTGDGILDDLPAAPVIPVPSKITDRPVTVMWEGDDTPGNPERCLGRLGNGERCGFDMPCAFHARGHAAHFDGCERQP